jgi:hypothetical protein
MSLVVFGLSEKPLRAIGFTILFSMALLCIGLGIHRIVASEHRAIGYIFLIMALFLFSEARMMLIRPWRQERDR